MLQAIIGIIIAYIRLERILEECLVEDNSTNAETFEYKGSMYDKNKFIQLKSEGLKKLKLKVLKASLKEREDSFENSKHPSLSAVEIEAYKKVIKEKEQWG